MEKEKVQIPIQELNSQRTIKVRVVGSSALAPLMPSFNEKYFSERIRNAQPELEDNIDNLLKETQEKAA